MGEAILGDCAAACSLHVSVGEPSYLESAEVLYWVRYSPLYALSNIKNAFLGGAPPVFLTAKAEHAADVPDIVNQLVTTRRLAGAESDTEDVH